MAGIKVCGSGDVSMFQEFNKDDLKTGMKVIYIDGSQGIVYRGHSYGDIIIHNEKNFSYFNAFDDNLVDMNKYSSSLKTIVEVLTPNLLMSIGSVKDCTYKSIWKREPDAKEMTVAELEDALGYAIKVVK